jgi:hypothetical protein
LLAAIPTVEVTRGFSKVRFHENGNIVSRALTNSGWNRPRIFSHIMKKVTM